MTMFPSKIKPLEPLITSSRVSSVVQCRVTGWSPGRGWKFFFSPPCPDRFWGPPGLLSNGYQGLFA